MQYQWVVNAVSVGEWLMWYQGVVNVLSVIRG